MAMRRQISISVGATGSSAPPPTTSEAPPPTTSAPPPTTSPPPPSSSPPPPPSSAPSPTPSSPSPSPSSSNAETSSPSPSQTPASSPATTSPPATTPYTTMTSQIPTTVVSTNAAGSTVIFTSTVATAIPGPVINPTPVSNNTTNTGAIVGGVVGGIAGLALLALLIFCLRRRSRREEFDGNFDPDRVGEAGGTLPQVDLTDETAPFPQPLNDQGASMRQYAEPPYGATGGPPGRAVSPVSSPSNYSHGSFPHTGPTGPYPQDNAYMRSIPPGAGQPQVPLNLYGAAPADWHQPQPQPMTSPAPSTVSRTATTSRSAKEREGRGQGLGLATQQEAPEGSGGVVVHQDAGRAPSDEHVGPREIPPAYESIQQ